MVHLLIVYTEPPIVDCSDYIDAVMGMKCNKVEWFIPADVVWGRSIAHFPVVYTEFSAD